MSAARVPERLLWVDVAKAIAILLVVVHHSMIFADAAGWLPASVMAANRALVAFRMPLFFLISGLFAASALRRPWPEVWRRRLFLFVYLYVLWTTLRFAFFLVVPDVRRSTDGATVADLAVSMVLPDTGTWFLYALATFSVVAKLARPVPSSWQLAVSALLAVAVAAGWLPLANLAWRGMGLYLVFFLIGMHLSGVVKRLAATATRWRSLWLACLAVLVVVAVEVLDAGRVPGVALTASLVAVAAGVSGAALLARTVLAAPLARLGSLTLPIYLMHVMVVAGSVAAVDALVAPSRTHGVLAAMVIVLVAVVVSLLAHRLLVHRFPAFFAVPGTGWLRRSPLWPARAAL